MPPSEREELYIQRQNLFCACPRHAIKAHLPSYRSKPVSKSSDVVTLLFVPVVLLRVVADVQAKTLGVEVDLVVALLQDRGDSLGVVELTQVDVRSALLDGVTDQLGGTSFTLGSDNHGLLFLPGLVNDEGGTLGVLLGNLLGFNSGSELG